MSRKLFNIADVEAHRNATDRTARPTTVMSQDNCSPNCLNDDKAFVVMAGESPSSIPQTRQQTMAAQGNEADQLQNDSDAGQPAPPAAAPGAASEAAPTAPVVALPADPTLANLAVPLVIGPNVANLVAPPAGPALANLAGALVPPDGEFDIPAGLVGSPPKSSNISFTIWP